MMPRWESSSPRSRSLMNSGRMAVAAGNSRPSIKKLIRKRLPKKRMCASANAVIEASRIDSATVDSAMTSEFHSDGKKLVPARIWTKLSGAQLSGKPNGLTRSSPTALKPPTMVV